VYFDGSYDVDRKLRYNQFIAPTADTAATEGYVGWFASLGTSFLKNKIVLNIGIDGPFNQPDPGDTENFANYPHLTAIFLIQEGVLPGFSIEASYDKKFIRTLDDLLSFEGAVIGARLNYKTGPAVISLVYNVRYRPEKEGAEQWEINSGLQSSISLF
jgi:hypothetical protein